MHGYRPVSSSQDSCCLDGQKLCVVACCMMSFLSIGTAAMLHLAPHHVAAGASYVGLDQNAVHGMHRHVNHWAQSSGLDAHLQRAGQWVAGVGHDMHRVGADFADHAGLDQHMQRAGDWAREVHQQLLGQDQILSPYDCTTADIPTWSHAHKEWCCEHQDTACAEASTTASTSPSPQHYMWISVPLHKGKYDCAAGIDNWLKGWSHGKQNWCCQNKGIGCLHEVSRPFDCLKGTASRWPAQKTVWCCLHENRGCPMQGASQVQKFDCDNGLSNWAVGWSTAKQEWCCAHHGRGCTQPAMEQSSFDCSTDLYHWHQRWSAEKKAWCCEAYSLGCHSDQEMYDCDAGYANWRAGWPGSKKAWCCVHASRGCLYDCEASQQAWSSLRRAWCCWHQQQGCSPEDGYFTASKPIADEDVRDVHYTVSAKFDCSAGYANWQAGWSTEKKAWCCQHQAKGCSDGR
mmetsp:Transcript_28267/g.66427  ORF Transcript_28267/g.66427 Transcript_28267/m.66427 type:complete len:458 (+) Transcript_28267:65-1438(+)